MPSDNTLPQIGAHCALPSCRINDFLPIRCGCQQLYCKDHIVPGLHACSKPSLESFISESTHMANRVPALCLGCGAAFCAEHRSPISHDCTLASDTTIPVSDKNAAAKALLAKHFGTDPASNTARPVPSSSKIHARKEAQQRQLAAMRMRHKAQPGNPKGTPASVPVDQRLHVKVVKADSPFSERIFWFSKTIGTGRALDLLATHFNLIVSDSQPLKLLSTQPDAEAVVLRTDRRLVDQISDGSSLMLSR